MVRMCFQSIGFISQILLLASICFVVASSTTAVKYEPNWESIDSRPLPQWFDDGKIGIFIHFGVYSVPSYSSEWFWCQWKRRGSIKQTIVEFMRQNYPPDFTYQDFARDLRLEFFDADEWIKIFHQSGAKYAVLTSKHHEGYTLWPSKYSFSWNSMEVGPHRDIVGEFAAAIKTAQSVGIDMRLGLYHSLYEWFNPLYLADQANHFKTTTFPKQKSMAELYELVETYKPDLIWSDGDAGPVEYWGSLEFLTWLYNESPVNASIVVNDRWGDGTGCKHGGYLNCADKYMPSGKQSRKWENALTLDTKSWGYRRNAKLEDYLTKEELISTLIRTVAAGGNFLIDVGPTKEGTIPLIMQQRLQDMGNWLAINGEAIYKTKPWSKSYNDSATPDVFYTTSKDGSYVYAMFTEWPIVNAIVLAAPEPTKNTEVTMLGVEYGGTNEIVAKSTTLDWKKLGKGSKMVIHLPNPVKAFKGKSCCAWTLRLSNLKNK